MGVLMLFHFVNFGQGSLFRKQAAEEPKYASVMPNEYSRFDTDEINQATTVDKSRNFIATCERSSFFIQSLDDEDGEKKRRATLQTKEFPSNFRSQIREIAAQSCD